MSSEDNVTKSDLKLGENLNEKDGYSFPQKCDRCEKEYTNLEEFISQTTAVENMESLSEGYEEDGRVVEVCRQCKCGSLLLEEFKDRRNVSIDGLCHRDDFTRAMKMLRRTGLSKEEAHNEVLKLIQQKGEGILKNLIIR